MISSVEKIDSTVVVLVVGLSFTMCCANSETDIYILLFFFLRFRVWTSVSRVRTVWSNYCDSLFMCMSYYIQGLLSTLIVLRKYNWSVKQIDKRSIYLYSLVCSIPLHLQIIFLSLELNDRLWNSDSVSVGHFISFLH